MNAPILVFDSGVGGLSVLGPIRALMPGLSVVYAADDAGFPYGTKSEAEIAARVPALLGRLVERYRPRLAVIACNTASTIALAHVRAALDLPVVGTVPAIKPAAAASVSRVIGVLGTRATVRQAYVDRLSAEFAADCTVLRHGSAALVEMAEAKLRGRVVSVAAVADELGGLTGQPGGLRMDRVVLACTHFPLLREELAAAAASMGLPGVGFDDGGPGIARRVKVLLGDDIGGGGGGLAVFTAGGKTGGAEVDALDAALQGFGLMRKETL
ncbi:glutamate racemase [Polymorphobacter sp.]|uniref:glutamate racemase n=1 Tax=Polymorphobacter sp. TaxID=1909290 RepID=UPI003F7216E9